MENYPRLKKIFDKYDEFKITKCVGEWVVYGIAKRSVDILAICATKERAQLIELCLNHAVKGVRK